MIGIVYFPADHNSERKALVCPPILLYVNVTSYRGSRMRGRKAISKVVN